MNTQIRPKATRIGLLFSAVYFASYVMRINFAVMLVKICSDMALPKTALAIVITGLTVTYGAGQIVSGFLGDRFDPRKLLTCGLSLAIVSNVTMFFCHSVPVMTVVWCINGMAHALLWPPIVRMMSMYLNDAEYSFAAVRVSWGSSAATILLYLVCPLLLYVMSWRIVMLLCAALGGAVLALWLALNPRLLDPADLPTVSKDPENTSAPLQMKLPKFVYIPIAFIALGIILQGILRDGVTNWMPSFLLETFGLSEENSIVSTVILAIFTMVSYSAFYLR